MINTMFEFNEAKHTYAVRAGAVPVGELYIESDGFYVFDPIVGRTGYWPAWMLKNIADKLDELNREWQQILSDDPAFAPEPLDKPEVLK